MIKRFNIITIMCLLSMICPLILSACDLGGHSHSYVWTTEKEGTCTEDGIEIGECSCGETITNTIKATGHSWGIYITTTYPTCASEGVETRTCYYCKAKETRTINASGHNYKSATCTEPQICTKCSSTYGTALGHTCTTGQCSRCGMIFYPPIHLPSVPLYANRLISNYEAFSIMRITAIEYEADKNGNIVFSYSGQKTYDWKGTNATTTISFKYRLLDADGYVVASGTSSIYDLKEGDRFRNKTFTISASKLSDVETSYFVLQILDD